MKPIKILLFVFLILPLINIHSQGLPNRSEVLEKMILSNKYFMDKCPDPTSNIFYYTYHPSNIWNRSVYYEGLMALYYIKKDTNYYNYALDWANYHKWNLPLGDSLTRSADNQCCGQTYIELYLLDKKYEKISAIKYSIDKMVNSTKSDDWYWIDAFQMSMPVFAKLGVIYNDNRYFEKMYDLFHYTKTKPKGIGLYNSNDCIWWRDSTYLPPRTTPNGKNIYWSRGNGWVFAALVRVLDILPENAPHRTEYVQVFKEMASSIIAIQRPDGFWNPSLVDSLDYGGKETSGTAFFTFGLAWGINNGVLEAGIYMPNVCKAWNAIVNNALHPDGMLGYVQGTGQQPSHEQPLSYSKPANFEDFGLGAFLLAGSEIYKLANDPTNIFNNRNITKSLEESLHIIISPNPFHENLNISFGLKEKGKINIGIYNASGKKVYSIVKNENYIPGNYNIIWNGCDSHKHKLPSGMYFLNISNRNIKKAVKFVIQN